ncbi:MAG: hypothetical protein H6703_04710 [Myxococcales bacterium]|nr:hypothetical protein [Myxococcales bacterium]
MARSSEEVRGGGDRDGDGARRQAVLDQTFSRAWQAEVGRAAAADAIGGARLEMLPGCGHGSRIERADAVNALIAGFVAGRGSLRTGFAAG